MFYSHNSFIFANFPSSTRNKSARFTIIAQKILAKIPKINVIANPRTKLVVIKKRIMATTRVVIFPSLIDDHALLYPSSIAFFTSLPPLISSRVREIIKILASIAIPTERIKPAIPERVRVTGIVLKRKITSKI